MSEGIGERGGRTSATGPSPRALAHEARRALGIDDLVLAIHDASFPSDPGEDVGRGTPYSRGARRLCAFADGLGFTGLQLGPQGVTTPANRSPYDGSVFSRSPLSISLETLCHDPAWEGIVDDETVEAVTSATPPSRKRGEGGHDWVWQLASARVGVDHHPRGSRPCPAGSMVGAMNRDFAPQRRPALADRWHPSFLGAPSGASALRHFRRCAEEEALSTIQGRKGRRCSLHTLHIAERARPTAAVRRGRPIISLGQVWPSRIPGSPVAELHNPVLAFEAKRP